MKDHVKPFILASGSPRRKQLCAAAGYEVQVQAPDVSEVHYDDNPERTVRENAQMKYAEIATGSPGQIVIAADTVLDFHGSCIGKPQDEDEARRIWRELSGQRHRVLTAVASGWGGTAPVIEVLESGVTFRLLTEQDMNRYLMNVNPLDKAGGYNIGEEVEPGLVEAYDGSYSNIMGLPMEYLQGRLEVLAEASQSNP